MTWSQHDESVRCWEIARDRWFTIWAVAPYELRLELAKLVRRNREAARRRSN